MTPIEKNFYMPAEWKPHECCWMQWPHENKGYYEIESWSNFDFEKGRIAWSNVAKEISKFEKVKMIIHPEDIKY